MMIHVCDSCGAQDERASRWWSVSRLNFDDHNIDSRQQATLCSDCYDRVFNLADANP